MSNYSYIILSGTWNMSTRIAKTLRAKTKRALTPRREPSQDRAVATCNAILEASAQLLTKIGYTKLTTNKIAEFAGVSIGSLYQYFPNKEAILVKLLEMHIVHGQERMRNYIKNRTSPDLSREDIIKVLIEEALTHHEDNTGFHKILEETIPHPVHIRQAVIGNERVYAELFGEYIGETMICAKDIAVKRARMAMVAVKSFTHWFIMHGSIDMKRDDFICELEQMIINYVFIDG
jgi:AcrR family transcriptional regulator